MECIVYSEKPSDFTIQKEAAGCYFWCQNRILLLKRHDSKPQGGTWGVPAGKLEEGETPLECVIREMQEELGIDVGVDLIDLGSLYVKLGELSYVFHMFLKPLGSFPEIKLSLEENVEARWTLLDEALSLPLIKAGKEQLVALKKYVSIHGI